MGFKDESAAVHTDSRFHTKRISALVKLISVNCLALSKFHVQTPWYRKVKLSHLAVH